MAYVLISKDDAYYLRPIIVFLFVFLVLLKNVTYVIWFDCSGHATYWDFSMRLPNQIKSSICVILPRFVWSICITPQKVRIERNFRLLNMSWNSSGHTHVWHINGPKSVKTMHSYIHMKVKKNVAALPPVNICYTWKVAVKLIIYSNIFCQ